MTTEVIKAAASANAIAALGNLKQGLQNVQSHIHTAGGEPILRMGRDGVWIYGADNVEVEDGSEWAMNPLSIEQGFICWKNIPQGSKDKPELLGEMLIPLLTLAQDRNALLDLKNRLPDYGSENKWADEIKVGLRCVSGEDEGEETIYKPSSTGGLRAMNEIIAEIMKAIDDHPATPVPVVALGTDHYTHKQYGKTYVPVLKIVRWVSMEGVEAPAETAPATAAKTGGKLNASSVENYEETTQPRATDGSREDDDDETTQVQEQPAQAANDTGERRRRRRA